MESTLIRITEKLLIIYFLGYFVIDIMLFIVFLITFRHDKKIFESEIHSDEEFSKTSIIVPAYNEEVSILQCIKMLSNLDYPDFEIIVVNDGSKDKTLEKILNSGIFEKSDKENEDIINTAEITNVYHTTDRKIVVIDKENGGKADSINAGINYSSGEFICTIDADSVLDRGSLKNVVVSMIRDKRVVVSGGQLAVSNDTVINDGRIVNFNMPKNILVLWQITEYIKSFLVSRIGLSKINSLLIMSGAFSLYRRDDLMKIGGFLTSLNHHRYLREIFRGTQSTVCEDMEIVVRLSRFHHENKEPFKVVFLPKPLCWTEVPDKPVNLFKQRARWHLGLAECMFLHRKMFFDPAYSATGLFAFPYYFFLELLSPFIKLFSLIFIILVAAKGLINTKWVLLMIVFITVTTALITSIITVYLERWGEKQAMRNIDALRYKSAGDWIKLLLLSIAGDFSYSFFKIFAQFKGGIDFIRQKSEWNKFERRGIREIASKEIHEVKVKT